MKSRLAVVTLSIVLGLLAAVAATGYVSSARAKLMSGAEPRRVFLTTKPIDAGTSFEEMLARGAVEEAEAPAKYVPSDAISSPDQVSGRVLLHDLAEGEALSMSGFKAAQGSNVAGQIPAGRIAVSIPVDEVTGVGASISPGDLVVVFATFSPGPRGVDYTKILLRQAQVITSSFDAKTSSALNSSSGTAGKKTVTLALTPKEAEKAVFAAEKGHVWVGLRPLAKGLNTVTAGQTMKSVFR